MLEIRLAILFILLAVLFGCDSPSIAFQGAPMRVVTMGPSTFSVRLRDDRVESIRTSREWRPSESAIMERAAQAIEQATGCVLRKGSLTGDQAIQRARVVCDDG